MLSSARQAPLEMNLYQSTVLIGDKNYEEAKRIRYAVRGYSQHNIPENILTDEIASLEKIQNKDRAIYYCLLRNYAAIANIHYSGSKSESQYTRDRSNIEDAVINYQKAMALIAQWQLDNVESDAELREMLRYYCSAAECLQDGDLVKKAHACYEKIKDKQGSDILLLIPLELSKNNNLLGFEVYQQEIKNHLITFKCLAEIKKFDYSSHVYIAKMNKDLLKIYQPFDHNVGANSLKHNDFFLFMYDLHLGNTANVFYNRFERMMRLISASEVRGNEDWFIQVCYYQLQILANALRYYLAPETSKPNIPFLANKFYSTVRDKNLLPHIEAFVEQLKSMSESLDNHANMNQVQNVVIENQESEMLQSQTFAGEQSIVEEKIAPVSCANLLNNPDALIAEQFSTIGMLYQHKYPQKLSANPMRLFNYALHHNSDANKLCDFVSKAKIQGEVWVEYIELLEGMKNSGGKVTGDFRNLGKVAFQAELHAAKEEYKSSDVPNKLKGNALELMLLKQLIAKRYNVQFPEPAVKVKKKTP